MNFLSNVCLVRSNSSPFWNTLYYRDIIKALTFFPAHCEAHRQKTKLYKSGNLCCSSSLPALWVQIRFNKGYPRFHRDIEIPNFDDYRKRKFVDVRKTKWGQGDEKVGYTYLVAYLGCVVAMYSVKTELTHFIGSMAAAADVVAMAQIEVNISKVAPGGFISLKWRGKPLFIKNRTQADIDLEAKTPLSDLKDPQTAEERTVKPEWLVVIGICTHLGCVPIPNSGDWAGGFYCPCHGSHYDNVGRARKGPAPLNLEVPPYQFTSDSVIVVG